ncbi:MAG: radical SAM family heme chaperone HemW [Flavisolibacter sp.]|nr:radical SAM family heme chaperone HemW [Flavisolibacter sp.]
MAGIYLHIPFCRQACHYCNFHFTTSLRYKDELIQALAKEMVLQKNYLEGEPVHTIYFGGGTPSLLPIADCRLLMDSIRKTFPVALDAEIILEANPDDISDEKLRGWSDLGINRLSIGVQSFIEEELQWMNRAHTAAEAAACIEKSLTAGFTNMSIDLIYGSPLLSDEQWQQNVEKALSYNIPHLSCYALTVEDKTPLHKQIQLQKQPALDNDKQACQFLLLMQWLKERGYEHYEVSNFAMPGKRSRHNSSYWRGEKYLGLGPSAHSYNSKERQWNIANNQLYIKAINEGEIPKEVELLTETQKLNEYIMISLRTKEGMDLRIIEKRWGTEKKSAISKQLHRYIMNGCLMQNDTIVQLTEEGMLRADGIAADLFS